MCLNFYKESLEQTDFYIRMIRSNNKGQNMLKTMMNGNKLEVPKSNSPAILFQLTVVVNVSFSTILDYLLLFHFKIVSTAS